MSRSRWRGAAAGASVVVGAATGVVTNLITSTWTIGLGVGLGVLLIIGVVLQVALTAGEETAESPDGGGKPSPLVMRQRVRGRGNTIIQSTGNVILGQDARPGPPDGGGTSAP